jgi:hypothetical protein
MPHLARHSATSVLQLRCQNVTYGTIRRGCIGAASGCRTQLLHVGTRNDERMAGEREEKRSGGRGKWFWGPPGRQHRLPVDMIGQSTLELGVDVGHGPWTRGWCARRCSGRSEKETAISCRPAGMPLQEMKGGRNGCFRRYASLKQLAKPSGDRTWGEGKQSTNNLRAEPNTDGFFPALGTGTEPGDLGQANRTFSLSISTRTTPGYDHFLNK